MGITGGGLNLGVAKQLPNHGQALAGRDCSRGERVSEIVDSHVIKPSAGANPLPERLQVVQGNFR
jgi:hypothetical protein